MSFSVFEKIDPSCQNGSMEKAKNIPYHQRPYASIAERTLVDISIYSPRPQIAGTGHIHSKISIHSPRAGRDCRYPNAPLITQISIHSPHTGRDRYSGHSFCSHEISIHSPRMGRDLLSMHKSLYLQHFNPLSPHGERRRLFQQLIASTYFNPLSPHGERPASQTGLPPPYYFNPLSPHGERHDPDPWSRVPAISIHSPRMGRDGGCGTPSPA